MSDGSNPSKLERVIVTDVDESAPAEYNDAQPPVVVEYKDGNGEVARGEGLSLKQRAVRSSMWTLTAFAAAQVIRVFSQPVLAQYLAPAMFGVVNLVSIFVTGLAALSDVGIEQSIIQHKRGDDPVFLNTAWTVHVVRGIGLWIGCCLIAWPVYWFYRNDPSASYILLMLPVSGLGPLIAGFNSTAIFTLNRHLEMGRITITNLLYQILVVIVTIAVAVGWASPWAIVIGGLAGNVFYLGASRWFLIPGYTNRFCWDPEVRHELMRTGRWIMISTLITYMGMQIDRLMLPKFIDLHWLGLYGLALGFVGLPREVIGRLASVTLFPALSRAAENDPASLPRVLLKARSLILIASMATMLGVILVAPLFVTLFFKPDFHRAGWLAQLSAIAAWITLLQISADRALLAVGKTKPLAVSNAVNLVVTLAGAIGGRWIDLAIYPDGIGINGFILGLTIGKVAGHLIIQVEMARSGMSIMRQDTVYTAALLVLSVAGIAIPRLLPGFGEGTATLYNGLVAVALCIATCAWAGLKVLRGIR